MNWWWRSRAGNILTAGTLVLIALGLLTGARELVVPAVLGGGSGLVAVSLFVYLAGASFLSYALDPRGNSSEAREIRSYQVFDVALFVLFLATFAGTMALVSTDPLRAATSVALLASVAAAVTCLLDGARGVLASTALVLLTSTYSPHLRGASIARILQPEADKAAAATAAVVAVITATAVLRYGRKSVTSRP